MMLSTIFRIVRYAVLVFILALVLSHLDKVPGWSCDIAVVSAKASSNGRPFIWKNRDCSESWHQEIKYFNAANSGPGGYVMVYNHDDLARLNNGTPINPSGGVNEGGFAVACTSVYEEFNQLDEAVNINTLLIWESLKKCVTIKDFDNLLKQWHKTHRGHVISGNFVAIDAYGGAALYECYTGTILGVLRPIMFLKYDANNGAVTNQLGWTLKRGSSDFIGFHNRTNANSFLPFNFGEERRWRARDILTDLAKSGRLNYRTAMRSLARDVQGQQLSSGSSEEDYSTTYCISRAATRVGLVVDGVEPGSDPRLATFWCALGEPSIAIFTPFFAHAAGVSHLVWVDDIDIDGTFYDMSDISLMNRAMNRRESYDNLIYETNTGSVLSGMDDKTINKRELAKVQAWSFPLEDTIIDYTDDMLESLRYDDSLVTQQRLRLFSDYCALYGYMNYNEASYVFYDWNFSAGGDPVWW